MKKIIPISLIFMGIATFGFSQDTAKAVIETPAIEEIAEPLEIISEPAIPEDNPVLKEALEYYHKALKIQEETGDKIDASEEKVIVAPESEMITEPVKSEKAADTAGIGEMPGIIEEIEEEILLIPEPEQEPAPVETISEENIQEEPGEVIADDILQERDEDKEKPKKGKIDVVDMVYKIAGTALVIGAFIVFPF